MVINREGPAGSKSATPVCDADELWERVEKDRDLLAMLLELYLRDKDSHLTGMARAIEHQDVEALTRTIHVFTGATATFGARAALITLKELDAHGREHNFARAAQLHARLTVETAELGAAVAALVSAGPGTTPGYR